MTTNFPSGLDAFTNPSATDAMDSVTVPHATQHADLNDAVEALQAKVGVDGSAVTTSLDYKVANQGLTLLRAVSIGSSVATIDVTGIFSSTYDRYLISYNVESATNGTQFSCKLISGTTVDSSTVYAMQLVYHSFSSATVSTAQSTSYPRFVWLGGMKGGSGSSWHSGMGQYLLINPHKSNSYTFCETSSYGTQSAGGHASGIHQTQASYDGFQFYVDVGTVTGGTITVYGYNNG